MPPVFDKKNILVTGGAGFIGSHVCEKLLATGARVICVDNLVSAQLNNIDFLLKNPDFEFIRQDIVMPFDPEQYPELERFKIKFQGVQEIYHLACPMSPKHFEQVSSLVTKDMTRDALAHGPDADDHVAAFRPFAEAGFDEIYLSQIGGRDDNSDIAGFFDFYRDEVLPALRAT